MDSAAFAYAVGRVRALEAGLLSVGDVERMLNAKDAWDAYRVFNDIEFSKHVGKAEDIYDFQRIINAELKDTKDLLEKIVMDDFRWVLEILWLRYDFHNLKVGMKAEILGWEDEMARGYLLDLGAISSEEMLAFGKGEKSKCKQERFIRAREKARKAYEEGGCMRQLEYALDEDLHALKLHLAKKSKNDFLVGFVEREIDIYNLVLYLRLQEEGVAEVRCEELWAHGGTLPEGVWEREGGDVLGEVMEMVKNSEYVRMAKAYEAYKKGQVDFAAVEREGDDLLVEYMRRTKHTPFGPEPLLAYYWAKKNNARVMRMIMVGKLAGISQDKIRVRLRKLYAD